MLGRQNFTGVSTADLVKACKAFEMEMTEAVAKDILTRNETYVEPFYEWLGATSVESFDASDYEKATHIWDMNQSLPPEFRGRYDFIFDGGTLEHIFNYPSALREAMTLPAVGGLLLSVTPADSYMGHGFYQFGPDLAFESFSKRNGFENIAVHLVEERPNPKFFKVEPPSSDRGRVLASGPIPIIMYFLGKRTGEVPNVLSASQPDYASAWKSGFHSERPKTSWKSMIAGLFDWIPSRNRNIILRHFRLVVTVVLGNSFWDRKAVQHDRHI